MCLSVCIAVGRARQSRNIPAMRATRPSSHVASSVFCRVRAVSRSCVSHTLASIFERARALLFCQHTARRSGRTSEHANVIILDAFAVVCALSAVIHKTLIIWQSCRVRTHERTHALVVDTDLWRMSNKHYVEMTLGRPSLRLAFSRSQTTPTAVCVHAIQPMNQ